MCDTHSNFDRDKRVNQIIADYLDAKAQGGAPDPNDLLTQYPGLADSLRSFFESNGLFPQIPQEPIRERSSTSQADAEILTIDYVSSEPPAFLSSEGEPRTVAPLGDAQTSLPRATLKPAAISSADVGIPGYEILEELGSGGMGIVFKARQLKLNRFVALNTTARGLAFWCSLTPTISL
ncbi:MAG: hypothetical protein ACFCD0_01830 [Gemmataceae bacterium]